MRLRQSATSIDWLLDALRNPDKSLFSSADRALILSAPLVEADIDLIAERWDTIRAIEAIPDDRMELLKLRYDLRSVSEDALWNRLDRYCRQRSDFEVAEDRVNASKPEDNYYASHLIDTLARKGTLNRQRLREWIDGPAGPAKPTTSGAESSQPS